MLYINVTYVELTKKFIQVFVRCYEKSRLNFWIYIYNNMYIYIYTHTHIYIKYTCITKFSTALLLLPRFKCSVLHTWLRSYLMSSEFSTNKSLKLVLQVKLLHHNWVSDHWRTTMADGIWFCVTWWPSLVSTFNYNPPHFDYNTLLIWNSALSVNVACGICRKSWTPGYNFNYSMHVADLSQTSLRTFSFM